MGEQGERNGIIKDHLPETGENCLIAGIFVLLECFQDSDGES